MVDDQLALFKRKKFEGVVTPQLYQIESPVQSHTIIKTLPAYYTYLTSSNYSKYTPDDFAGDIKRLGFYLKDKELKDIKPVDLQQWISELKKTHKMSAKTVSRKISAFKNYFNWLIQEKTLLSNPADEIYSLRVTAPLPDILFEEECQRLLSTASTEPRSYLIFLLFLQTAITMEELTGLKVQNFDFSNQYAPELWVKHSAKKIKKDRKLKLPVEINTVFKDYLKKYTISDILFPVTDRFIRLVITQTAEKAQVKKRVSPQILRDTCIVRWLKNGEEIDVVLTKAGLSTSTREDAKEKYLKLISKAL